MNHEITTIARYLARLAADDAWRAARRARDAALDAYETDPSAATRAAFLAAYRDAETAWSYALGLASGD